ncbi:ankyrin repeat protein [Colletotrichum scovillei]|uniref:Ankyrin repeat protein n=1 Tax=Colletotrichum scovillei TaxID=1209932 RepID=A0A9P7QT31_9PEZI|nr:ankyrin repeat protein [Colletotrichum scovillei]
MNAFGGRSRSSAGWFFAGLDSSFPDLGTDESNLSDLRFCGTDLKAGCKVFQVRKSDPSRSTEVLLAPDILNYAELEGDLKDQVLVFKYKGKFHAVDHKCPHSSYPLSHGTPFDIEDFGIILSAVTGGGGSMGLEVARSVLESGGDVICIDRQEKPLEEPWNRVLNVSKSHGTQAWYYRCDITDAENVKSVFAESMKKLRFPFRGLVACAGISGDAPSIDFPINTARSIIDINVIGTLICAQAAAQEIQRQGSAGSIVLIASMSAHGSNKGVDTVAYNSSKSAVVQMARSLAAEWGSRADIPLIRVNSISPGYIRTRVNMDPSGIIGIISVVAQIVTTCTKLGLSWRDAPEDAKKFKNEMDGLYKTLSQTSSLLIQNPEFIAAFEGQHSAVLSNLKTLSSPDDESLLSACQDELARILNGLQKQLEGSRFGWQRFKAIFSGEMTQSAIENLQRRCQVINSMISIDITTLAAKTNLEVRSLRKNLAERHLDESRRRVLDQITSIDFTAQQIDNLDRRQEGTGKWLLESPEFEAWVLGDRRTLFCPGMPGAGKTMLSSIVIEYLKRRFEGNSVYVVIDALDELDDDRNMLLEAILNLQKTSGVNIFATSRHIPEIERYFGNSPHIEIRAVDGDVMKFLDGQISKLPLAVRKNEDLQDQIKSTIVQAVQGMFLLAQLHLDSLQGKRSAKAVKEALCKLSSGSEAYDVAYEKAMERIDRQLEDQKSLAIDALSWIVCARRPLKTMELQHALAVERGTTELDEDNIPELEDVVSACAGLVTIDEESQIIRLVHYTTQEYFERTKGRWMPEAQRLLSTSCVAYLSYDRFKFTFEEHLERIHLDAKEKAEISRSRGYQFSEMVNELVISENPLYDYAACNWGYHAKYIYPPDQETLSFLTDRGYNRSSSFHLPLDKSKFAFKLFYWRPPPRDVCGIHLAAYFGLIRIFELLKGTDKTNLNLGDSYGYSPLFYAILGGDEEFLKYLLAQGGLELNKKAGPDRYHMFPLQIAVECGNKAAVRDLIRTNRVHLDAKDFLGRTALLHAAYRGNVDIFKLLVETGKVDIIDLNASERSNSILRGAVVMGRIEIVKYLVEAQKVDIESQTLAEDTPFFSAISGNQLEVARYLHDTGLINPNAANCRGETLLHYVARRDGVTLRTAQWLLDDGKVDASLLTRTSSGKMPLDLALENREPEDPVIKIISDRMALLQTTKIEQAMDDAMDGH